MKNFKLSSDLFFVEKIRDVMELYLSLPDQAIVLSVDEKSQIQALDRTQRVSPMGLGYVEGVIHDYVCHGTTTLFASLDIASTTVLTECKARHRHQESLEFFKRIDQAVPAVSMSTSLSTTTPLISIPRYDSGWHNESASRCTPRQPTRPGSIRSNGGVLSHHAAGHRRGGFRNVKDLIAKINHSVQHYNHTCRPFAWTATADSILQKLGRLCSRISGITH